jgi:hypothetical protein
MHCETQQRSLPRLLTLNAPMTGLRIPRAMNLPSRGRRADSAGDESASRGRRVNTSNASPLWVSEIDLNNVAVMPAPVVIGPDGQGCAAARRADRRHAAAADSGDRARPRPRSRPPANASKARSGPRGCGRRRRFRRRRYGEFALCRRHRSRAQVFSRRCRSLVVYGAASACNRNARAARLRFSP